MNQATFIGRLGRNPEERTTASGERMTTWSIAVRKGRDETLWVDCAAFGKTAEVAAKYLAKGDQCAVTGSVDVRSYTGKDGSAKSSLSCRVGMLELLGGRQSEERGEPTDHDLASRGGQLRAVANNPRQPRQADDFDDQVPF